MTRLDKKHCWPLSKWCWPIMGHRSRTSLHNHHFVSGHLYVMHREGSVPMMATGVWGTLWLRVGLLRRFVRDGEHPYTIPSGSVWHSGTWLCPSRGRWTKAWPEPCDAATISSLSKSSLSDPRREWTLWVELSQKSCSLALTSTDRHTFKRSASFPAERSACGPLDRGIMPTGTFLGA